MIKVLVVDDHDLVRMGISRMLSDSIDIEVIGEADSGDMAIKLAKQLRLMWFCLMSICLILVGLKQPNA